MDVSEIIAHLEYFGLEETDSRVYTGLLQLGSISVGNMAARLEIDRGKAYRSLNKLKNLGIVSTTFSNPTICSAIEPKQALATIIEKKQDEITTMKNLAVHITGNLKKITRNSEEQTISTLSIIQGRTNIYTRIGKLIQTAKKTVFIVSTLEDLAMMYHTSIPEKIDIAKKNGADVKVLTSLESGKDYSVVFRLNASEVHVGKLPSKSRIIVESNNQLLMSGSINDQINLKDDNDTILYTNSQEMVNNMFSLCSLLWGKSKKPELEVSTIRKST